MNTFTKKDFSLYLSKGGSLDFSKKIYLSKTQYNKLTKDQKEGRAPVIIDGKQGYMSGDGYWNPVKE